jgi:hypothetical protein
MPTIEAALPRRLRHPSSARLVEQSYSPQDISRIIHISSKTYGLDLLTHLAIDKKRPSAAVWLATLVAAHDSRSSPPPLRNNNLWNAQGSLSAATEHEAIVLKPPLHETLDALPPSLDKVTDELHPNNEPLPSILHHETLGQVWQSLALMIIRDAARADKDPANPNIKPEILEIIAMLHHSGAMPSSIYSYQPPEDSISLCQPPTLHLLSNQIITSLTDAVWRAHERNVVEEANAEQNARAKKSRRPEIPSSVYNVHVTGLGHEVWLELVLWVCLHGRFYEQGATILSALAKRKGKDAWSVLSWRELANPVIQSGQEKSINWDELKHIFNTGIFDTDQLVNKSKVRRTVSAEVIASFVDATVSHVSAGVGARGISPEFTARFLKDMKSFLSRNNMSLGFTSWDAIVLRFFESKGVDFEKDPALVRRVTAISSAFGDDIATINAPTRDQLWQPTPAYVLDGTAAPIGHLHHLLRAQITLGSLRGALGVFEALQTLTDTNKERSIQEFLTKQQDADTLEEADDESSKFDSGIHYPSFFHQIPTPILADFLDLVVQSDELALGSWLVYSKDVDGAIIHKGLYKDPIMAPSLVRLAANLGDNDLMNDVFYSQKRSKQGDLPMGVLTAVLEEQIQAGDWDFVERALENFARLPGYSIGTHTTAIIMRTILREAKACNCDFATLETSDAAKTFQKMISVIPLRVIRGTRNVPETDKLAELGGRIWRLLAAINEDWRMYAWKTYPKLAGRCTFRFVAKSFNKILRGVVYTYGSTTGKEYLGKFWPDSLAEQSYPSSERNIAPGGVPRMVSRREDTPVLTSTSNRAKYGEHRIRIDGPDDKRAIITVDLFTKPNVATIKLILKQALLEHTGDLDLICHDVEWARQMMRKLGLEESYIRAELRGLPAFESNHSFDSDDEDTQPLDDSVDENSVDDESLDEDAGD